MGRAKKLSLGTQFLTPMESAFVQGMLEGKTQIKAAEDAGYTKSSARSKAYTLVKEPRIQKAIAEGQNLALKMAVVSVAQVVQGLSNIAFFDISQLVDNENVFLPLKELPEAAKRVVTGVKKTIRHLKNGDIIEKWDYQIESRQSSLDSLADIAGLSKKEESVDPSKLITSIADLVRAASDYGKTKVIPGVNFVDEIPKKS